MYSKEEAYQKKKDFWIAYGGYMKLQMNAEERRVNWVNYKTGVKGLYFKSDVDRKFASVAIEMSHANPAMNEMIWEQFEAYEVVLASYLGNDCVWNKNDQTEDGKPILTIGIRLENVSIFRESDYPAIIDFLKTNMIALDAFWTDHQESFDVFKTM